MRTGRRKSGSLKTGKRCCGKKLSQEERRTRSHRLIVRGAVFESIVPEAKTMTDEEARRLSPACLDERGSAGLSEKRTKGGKSDNPFGTKGALIHPYGCVRSAEGLSAQRESRLLPLSDRHWRLCRNKGLHPLRRLRGYPCTPTKTVHPPLRLYHFCGFYYPIREVIPIAIYLVTSAL